MTNNSVKPDRPKSGLLLFAFVSTNYLMKYTDFKFKLVIIPKNCISCLSGLADLLTVKNPIVLQLHY